MNAAYANIDNQLLLELIRQLTEMNRQLNKIPDPDEIRSARIRLISDLLNECRLNIKSKGYVYISEAVYFIITSQSSNICLSKDIYPRIAERHESSINKVEHSIRNAIQAAFKKYEKCAYIPSLMKCFSSAPSSKEFLYHIAREAELRLADQLKN